MNITLNRVFQGDYTEGILFLNGAYNITALKIKKLRRLMRKTSEPDEKGNVPRAEIAVLSEKLLNIAGQTGLIRLINQLPEGFYTEVGEHGLDLSGGERQRIAFARALYHEPDMLILDEATSALDPVSEKEIFNLIKDLRNSSMSLVIISHKLSLVRDADHIVLIDDGQAMESGRHKDLMQLNGLYRQLWSAQNSGS